MATTNFQSCSSISLQDPEAFSKSIILTPIGRALDTETQTESGLFIDPSDPSRVYFDRGINRFEIAARLLCSCNELGLGNHIGTRTFLHLGVPAMRQDNTRICISFLGNLSPLKVDLILANLHGH